MKKLFLIAVLLLPACVFAQHDAFAYAGREGKVMLLADMFAGKFKRASLEAAKEDSKGVAFKQAEKAADSMRRLMSAYPEYSSLISEVADTHKRLVDAAKTAGKEDKIFYQKLTYELEYLYEDFSNLQKANPDVAAQVKEMVNHQYWVHNAQSLMTVSVLKNEILRVFTVVIDGSGHYTPLKIKGDGWLSTLQ